MRARDAGQAAQRFGDEVVERAGVLGDDLEQVRIETGDPVALEHLGDGLDAPGKSVVVAGMGDAHADERADVLAEAARIDEGHVAAHHSRFFQLPDAVGDRGLGEADRGRDLHLRRARVALQQLDDPIIYRIRRHLVIGQVFIQAHIEFDIGSGRAAVKLC